MKTRKLVLAILLAGMLVATAVYFWREFHLVEFYPFLHTRCLEPVAYDDFLSGQLVLMPQDAKQHGLLERYKVLTNSFSTSNIIYSLKTGEMTYVGTQSVTGNFASSPDGKRLAYEEIALKNGLERRYLVVRSYKGSETRIEMEVGQSFVYWLDNYRVMLQKESSEKLPAVEILNLDTSETQRVTSAYPNWNNTWSVAGYYSPDMTRVIYPDNTEYIDPTYIDLGYSYIDPLYADLILYDDTNGEQLLRINQIHKLDEVEWKSDSNGFFLALNNVPIGKDLNWASAELRFLDRNGVVKWKINFADVNPDFQYSLVTNLLLSPDQRFLSVEVGPAFFNSWRLFIDTVTGDIFDYCVRSDYPGVWSPDGRYFAIANGVNDEDGLETLIIDVNHRKIYKVADGYVPVGWLK